MARYAVSRPMVERKLAGLKPRLRPKGKAKSKDELELFMQSQLSRIRHYNNAVEKRIHTSRMKAVALSVDVVGSVGYVGRKCPTLSQLEGGASDNK